METKKMSQCPKCGVDLQFVGNFCMHCGAPLQSRVAVPDVPEDHIETLEGEVFTKQLNTETATVEEVAALEMPDSYSVGFCGARCC